MRTIRCAILDDEPMAVALLSKYVEKISSFELVKATTNPFEILQLIAQTNIDVLFIDIQMPELTGIQMMEMLGNKTKFVITSAYSEYALKGYEHNVVDYLLKPISFDRFYKCIQKIESLAQEKPAPTVEIAAKTEEKPDEFLFIKTDGKLVKINLNDLLLVEGLKDYLYLHLKNEKLIVLDTLKDFEAKLPASDFMRVHKSYIIRLDQIETIERNRVFIQKNIVPIGETYKIKFQDWVKSFL
ncbi:LytR/AlgR family response regulator transcription factor [Flavobacterium lindanitolerans]|uniref:DNA-binding LytR/AlgR family response regulator n=1 Tax=Flavobacterium lindanitolerans TaxID=428988 RepID=A0A497UWL4_9FLAO|nr:LytTR family DNA-binding domain-containing protein [Flavobacterium lindanitolerans]PKW20821.1 LytTR family two component transcriptional regulator [Flavobacterium lindanitolerans]RLJ30539.1 DNA-binding LytR/AlgR family response regulator [Flavobacterium lindanitolerans]